jgi:organic hydroperoxide reductase OsmC/OhrA
VSAPVVRPKEFRFPLAVEAAGGRRVAARVEGKPELEVAPPPEFRGTDPTVWSPEDLFVGAAATCLAVTFNGLAGRAGLDYDHLAVDAAGIVGQRPDGRFGFTKLELALRVAVAAPDEPRARELAERADETCLVSVSLDVPIELRADVTMQG